MNTSERKLRVPLERSHAQTSQKTIYFGFSLKKKSLMPHIYKHQLLAHNEWVPRVGFSVLLTEVQGTDPG